MNQYNYDLENCNLLGFDKGDMKIYRCFHSNTFSDVVVKVFCI